MNGGFVNIIGNLIGDAAHKFLGVNPETGKIIGAVAGNVIFSLGGKDNSLGNIGKIILDNIISGKFRRDVDPFVPPAPSGFGGGGGGGGGPVSPALKEGEVIDFYAERDKCIQDRRLYEDPYFPADDSSLYYTNKRPSKRVKWMRPGELTREPMLIAEGHSRFDVIQGELGDCWLLAAAANLTLRDELFYRVVPPDQSFTENYAGIFHFQFWHYGKWVDVVIDDRLPCADGELLYMHSASKTEFWSALLEKAYAKLHGTYEALKGGTTSEALEDFTGGLTEFIDLHQPPPNVMQMMLRGFEMGSLFGCSIEADPNIWEARLPNGLVKGHAYSITGMRVVPTPNGEICVVRIRNPWGNEQEWNGPWSDNSREWKGVPDDVKRDMGLTFEKDGEFWMSFDDFMRNFEKMEICNLGPDVMNEVYQMTGVKGATAQWATNTHDGAWIRNQTAGGCRNYINTFANNPQYRVTLTDSDPDDEDELCTVIFAVLQKYRREMKPMGLDNVPIGFAVYDAGRAPSGKLGTQFFKSTKSAMRSAAFVNLREMTGRFRVPPGNYVIVPSTFEPNEEAEFMLRIYTNGFIESEEL
ncbi:clp-1 [Pristionchus pacificus]|nr:clp-1 [Pristionchus pacificus]